MAGQGFAALSVEARKAMARRGGKAAVLKGRKHNWTAEEAKKAAQKGVEARKKNLAFKALKELLGAGFTPQQLEPLGTDELIYFRKHQKELKERFNDIQGTKTENQ